MEPITPTEQAKLKFLIRRGMLELDILLAQFLEKVLPTLTHEQYLALEAFLQESDPDLLNWLMGYETPEDEATARTVAWITSLRASLRNPVK